MDRKTFRRGQVDLNGSPLILVIYKNFRDDLELVHKGVQTDIQSDFSFTVNKDVNKTNEKFTQTDDDNATKVDKLMFNIFSFVSTFSLRAL